MFKRDDPSPINDDPGDWPHLIERAADAVLRTLRGRGDLRPDEIATRALSVLPVGFRRRMLAELRSLGWLSVEARIPFDILESPDCPLKLDGGPRELMRVAVFGVTGEGSPGDSKRREAIYQQRCTEIMREIRDLESLSYAAARALGHPEVNADPVLQGMLRAFISERETEIRARAPIQSSEGNHVRTPKHETPEFRLPLRERVQGALSKLRLELESHLTNYNESGAAEVIVRIHDLRKRFPGHVEAEMVERCEEQVNRLGEKRVEFRSQLTSLTDQAVKAVKDGDPKTAAWVLRRLSAIHTLLPAVLAEQQLKEYREQILQCEQHEERREAARCLVERERLVGAEIKRLGAIIHRYHRLSQKSKTDKNVLQQAQAEYEKAVDEARTFNDDWLADLMIELDCLLEDLHGPRERAEAQVDLFVNNVRSALEQMRAEIREIQTERAVANKGG